MKADILNPMWRYFRAVDTSVARTFDRVDPGWRLRKAAPHEAVVRTLKQRPRGKT